MPFNPATHQITRFYQRYVDVLRLQFFCETLTHTNLTVQDVRNAVQSRAAEIYMPRFSIDVRLAEDVYCLALDEEPWCHYWTNIAFVLQVRQSNTSGKETNGNGQSKNDVEIDPQNLLKITNSAKALLKLLKDINWEHKKYTRRDLEQLYSWN